MIPIDALPNLGTCSIKTAPPVPPLALAPAIHGSVLVCILILQATAGGRARGLGSNGSWSWGLVRANQMLSAFTTAKSWPFLQCLPLTKGKSSQVSYLIGRDTATLSVCLTQQPRSSARLSSDFLACVRYYICESSVVT